MTQEEGTSNFKKGRFDNKPSLNTRKEASKTLKKLLEGLDKEFKGDVKDVYYIIENRGKVGIPLVSLKVIIFFTLIALLYYLQLLKYFILSFYYIIILEISEIIGRKVTALY